MYRCFRRGGIVVDTVDIRLKSVKIDTYKFRKFFGYSEYELTGVKTGDIKEYKVPSISKGKFCSENIGINYIGCMKKPNKVNDVYNLELVKVSIPKLLGYANNNVVINDKRKIEDAFSKLVKTLKSFGIQCKKMDIEFTRIDFPLHIEVEDFDQMRMLFNLMLQKYKGKIFYIHERGNYLRDNRSTGIEFSMEDRIDINIYDKLRQMQIEKKPGEKDIIRVETRFTNITVIKKYFGGNSYKDVTLDKIKTNIAKIFEKIKDKVFAVLAEETTVAENLHYLPSQTFEKNLMKYSHMYSDKNVVLKAIDVVARDKEWSSANVNKKRSQVNRFYRDKAVTGDIYGDNFARIELFFNKMLTENINAKDELNKAYYVPYIYWTRVASGHIRSNPEEFQKYGGTVVRQESPNKCPEASKGIGGFVFVSS